MVSFAWCFISVYTLLEEYDTAYMPAYIPSIHIYDGILVLCVLLCVDESVTSASESLVG